MPEQPIDSGATALISIATGKTIVQSEREQQTELAQKKVRTFLDREIGARPKPGEQKLIIKEQHAAALNSIKEASGKGNFESVKTLLRKLQDHGQLDDEFALSILSSSAALRMQVEFGLYRGDVLDGIREKISPDSLDNLAYNNDSVPAITRLGNTIREITALQVDLAQARFSTS